MPALSQEEDVGSCVVFPDDPFFSKLLSAAKRRGNATIIHEKSDGIQANYNQLIHDVHVLRQQIQSNLPDDLLDINGMVKQEGLYIAILAQGGYKFLVACIATLAIGAAAIPLCKH
jgi:malonyl-CoA/methylmalonyl-CoA synthetase